MSTSRQNGSPGVCEVQSNSVKKKENPKNLIAEK